jgi:hypothetical protein
MSGNVGRTQFEVVVRTNQHVSIGGGEPGVEGRHTATILWEHNRAHRQVGVSRDDGLRTVDIAVEDDDRIPVGMGLSG